MIQLPSNLCSKKEWNLGITDLKVAIILRCEFVVVHVFLSLFPSSQAANLACSCPRGCLLGVEQKLESLGSGVEGSGKVSEGIAFWCRGITAFSEGVMFLATWGFHSWRDHQAGQPEMVTQGLIPPWVFVRGAKRDLDWIFHHPMWDGLWSQKRMISIKKWIFLLCLG